MNKTTKTQQDETLPEYDFSNGGRGKYAARMAVQSNIVVLSPDVAEAFPNSDSVNEALRLLMQLAQQSVKQAAS